MKNLLKTKTIATFLLFLCSLVCILFAFFPQTWRAKAEEKTDEGFTLTKGAYIRYSSDAYAGEEVSGDTSGIRFSASITKEAYNRITDNGAKTITEKGILVASGDFTSSEQAVTVLKNNFNQTKVPVTQFHSTNNLDNPNATEYTYSVAVYDIQDYAKEYAFLGYLTVGEDVYYTQVATDGDNIRSIFQVATAFKADSAKYEVAPEAAKTFATKVVNTVTQGVEYSYDSTKDCYYVSDIADASTVAQYATVKKGEIENVVVRILDEYDDGTHGTKAVTYMGSHCFANEETITHLILPESVTELRVACFQGMSKLKYVAMPGVTEIKSKDSSNVDSNAQFRYCNALTAVVVKNSLDIRTSAFTSDSDGVPANQVQVYALEDGGTFPFGVNDGGWINVNVALKTEDGTHTNVRTGSPLSVLVKDENGTCGTWKYDTDGYSILLAQEEHTYTNSVCTKCGAFDSQGIAYSYDSTTQTYYVSGIEDKTRFVANSNNDVVVTILTEYNDGTHGKKAVTYIGTQALMSSTTSTSSKYNSGTETITHLILPESITELKSACCQGMSSLKSVFMPGVSLIGDSSNNAQFRYCPIETVIIKKSLTLQAGVFINTGKSAQVYALESGGTLSLQIGGYGNCFANATAIVYDENSMCGEGTWKYGADGYTVVVPEHDYDANGKCSICQGYDTRGITYTYDSTAQTYYVSAASKTYDYSNDYNENGDLVLRILPKYNDGTNGEKDVTYVGTAALRSTTDLTNTAVYNPYMAAVTHLILPESVTKLSLQCCVAMTNLEYVAMPGVTLLSGASSNANYAAQAFNACTNLKTIIIKNTLSITLTNDNIFKDIAADSIQIYALESGATVKFGNIGDYAAVITSIITTDGTHVYGNNNAKILVQGTDWNYAADGYTIVPVSA